MKSKTQEHNEQLAAALITLAEYIQMSETPAKVSIGLKFKLPKRSTQKFPVMPIDNTLRSVSAWAAQEIIDTVKRYQRSSGTEEGQHLIDRFTGVRDALRG